MQLSIEDLKEKACDNFSRSQSIYNYCNYKMYLYNEYLLGRFYKYLRDGSSDLNTKRIPTALSTTDAIFTKAIHFCC